jgi:hypothetical protein
VAGGACRGIVKRPQSDRFPFPGVLFLAQGIHRLQACCTPGWSGTGKQRNAISRSRISDDLGRQDGEIYADLDGYRQWPPRPFVPAVPSIASGARANVIFPHEDEVGLCWFERRAPMQRMRVDYIRS